MRVVWSTTSGMHMKEGFDSRWPMTGGVMSVDVVRILFVGSHVLV